MIKIKLSLKNYTVKKNSFGFVFHFFFHTEGTYLAVSSPANLISWRDNFDDCIQNGGVTVSFQTDIDMILEEYYQSDIDAKLKDDEQFWTNVIRSPVIISFRANDEFDKNSKSILKEF
jgi:hypothetical protein